MGKILIVDDSKDHANTWVKSLQDLISDRGMKSEWEVTFLEWKGEAKTSELAELRRRQKKFHAALRMPAHPGEAAKSSLPNPQAHESKKSSFDDVDILFIDYKLFSDDSRQDRLTGLELGYLIRAYTECRAIVALNAIGGFSRASPRFDLTLRAGSDRIEDLHLAAEEIDSPGLWGKWEVGSYRPWQWPSLPLEAKRRDKRCKIAEYLLNEELLSVALLELLGIRAEHLPDIPASAIDHLGAKGSNSTLADFVMGSGHVLRPEEFETNSGIAEMTADKVLGVLLKNGYAKRVVTRLLASSVARWLERMVLPAQSLFVDRAHLISEWPKLREHIQEPSSIASWINDFADPEQQEFPEGEVMKDIFEQCGVHAPLGTWLSRPVYWRDKLDGYEVVARARDYSDEDQVFLEDMSAFDSFENSVQFKCDFQWPMHTRYCSGQEKFGTVTYEPASRFAT